jgi:hypothetical protein
MAATSALASSIFAARISAPGRASSSGPHSEAAAGAANSAPSASHRASLFAIESSMLIRSMPSV